MRAGRVEQGGSTLTQQLAKNLFLGSERTLARKLEELVLALWLEARLGKRNILELYLNRVYLGAGTYGVEMAARRFFGKSAREVSVAEAATLAGLLKAPSRYSPAANQEVARARAQDVLAKMVEARLPACGRRRQGRSRHLALRRFGAQSPVRSRLRGRRCAGSICRRWSSHPKATSSSRPRSTATCSVGRRRWCRPRFRAKARAPGPGKRGSC